MSKQGSPAHGAADHHCGHLVDDRDDRGIRLRNERQHDDGSDHDDPWWRYVIAEDPDLRYRDHAFSDRIAEIGIGSGV